VAQGQATAMNLCEAMTYTLDPVGLLYDGSPPAALDVSAAVYDPVGDIHLLAMFDGSNYSIRVSTDNMLTTTEVLAPAAGIRIDSLAIVPGGWVFADRNASNWLSSAYPYTSWTTVSVSATFTSNDAAEGHCVATLDGVESMLMVGNHLGTAYLAHTPTATRPTISGDWTELTPATMTHAYGIATDGTINVIAGALGGNPTIAYAGIADGGLSGDWTTVTVGTGSYVWDVVHDGEKFVCVDDNGDAHYSFDGATWVQTGSAGASGNRYSMATDPSTGFLVAYDGLGAGAGRIVVSRDGVAWYEAAAASGLDVTGTSGRYGFDTRRGRLFAGNAATVAALRTTG
jgi:hypothetical protein